MLDRHRFFLGGVWRRSSVSICRGDPLDPSRCAWAKAISPWIPFTLQHWVVVRVSSKMECLRASRS